MAHPRMLKAGDIRRMKTGMWGAGETSWAVFSDPYTYTLFSTETAAKAARNQMFAARPSKKRFVSRETMKRRAKKHAGNFSRRGTGHVHPAGPRKCPKCGV